MIPIAAALAALGFAPAPEIKPVPGDWPQFRGPDRNAVSTEKGLLQQWPTEGPKKLWTVSGCGGGYSTVSVVGGWIFGTGKKDSKEYVWARDEATGEEKWATPFTEAKGVGYGEGTRSTPTFSNGKVYAVGMNGELVCCEATTGKILWHKNYAKDFGGVPPGWGYCESVLVDEGKVIGTPCSAKAAMVALDANTGETIWQTAVEKPGGAGGYASPIKAEVGGVPMYINLLGKTGGVIAVHAKTGKTLWQYDKMMNGTANIPSPVVKGDMVFCSTGYGAGSALLQMETDKSGGVSVKEIRFYKGDELQNHHGGMIPVGDYVYFGNQHGNGNPVCVDLKSGDIKWKEKKNVGGGGGSAAIAYADGMLYFRYENGTIVLIKADPEHFKLVSSFKIPEPSGKASWPHPTIANGRLFIRDQDKLHCFNLKDSTN
ncbi:PQQ-binding-like beta-propeller repeat protein [Fimbriiglobus ruber]|uniref:Putative polyvinylalcohol dehydrogenase n=1 Tax=Fimbriiglobus ruber TaxID=1908690 RepID=A0A225D8L9_9BACT|nr:PQQ-binding-like beta-propeller repeat protein [Fimbriiglobus ruber]OWK34878.1 putative polyvinylalcohol dehydrogenase [Fimbriiglobus ruber]